MDHHRDGPANISNYVLAKPGRGPTNKDVLLLTLCQMKHPPNFDAFAIYIV